MTRIARRHFLAGLGGAAASLGLGSVAEADTGKSTAGEIVAREGLLDHVPFDGPYQAGILTPRQDQATFLALDSLIPNRGALAQALQQLPPWRRLRRHAR